jgi:DNA-binding transcriptional MerR regulator
MAVSNETTDTLPEEADLPDKLYFRIGEVAQLVGVDSHVLRYWESEFKMKPHRSSSGQRLYRKQDLARFYRIKGLLHGEGYTIAGARRVLNENHGSATSADNEQIREALKGVGRLRLRIQAFRDEMDPNRG